MCLVRNILKLWNKIVGIEAEVKTEEHIPVTARNIGEICILRVPFGRGIAGDIRRKSAPNFKMC